MNLAKQCAVPKHCRHGGFAMGLALLLANPSHAAEPQPPSAPKRPVLAVAMAQPKPLVIGDKSPSNSIVEQLEAIAPPSKKAGSRSPSAGDGETTGSGNEPSIRQEGENQQPPSSEQSPQNVPEQGAPQTGSLEQPLPEPLPVLAPVEQPDLQLAEVLSSVFAFYPELQVLRGELQSASGRELAALGSYDFKIMAESLNAPLGFYQNYRQLVKLEQPLWMGGAVSGQYRIGDGFFPVWYGERETNEGGEFKLRFSTPLLRDRRIDAQRAQLFQATLRRRQFDPLVQSQLLEFSFAAADVYWSWVLAGLSVEAQQGLRDLTATRNRIYEARVKEGDLAALELLQNERLLASRQAKVVEAQRKFQQSAIKLSLFYRDRTGVPLLASPERLPRKFPDANLSLADEASAVSIALAQRPEFRDLDFQRRVAGVDLSYGRNQRLPNLGVLVDASKDVGAPASSRGDKTPFELETGLFFDMPLQRRKAAGKIVEAQGKLAAISAKRRFVENKVVTQVQDAYSALLTAAERIEQNSRSAELARRLAQAEQERMDAGDSDILRVTLQETASIEATIAELEARADYFKALAALAAATALDPLEW